VLRKLQHELDTVFGSRHAGGSAIHPTPEQIDHVRRRTRRGAPG
jgi:hypothetical protein